MAMVEPARPATGWKRSTRCKSDGGNCVEIKLVDPDGVAVRKSTQVSAAMRNLVFGGREWACFMLRTRSGSYDL